MLFSMYFYFRTTIFFELILFFCMVSYLTFALLNALLNEYFYVQSDCKQSFETFHNI